MNILEDLPIEIYKKILFNLDPNSLFKIIQIDTFTNKLLSDDNFYRDYLINNYDCHYYGFENWNLSNIQTENFNKWKNFVKFIFNGIEIPLYVNFPSSSFSERYKSVIPKINICYEDTLENINLKCKKDCQIHFKIASERISIGLRVRNLNNIDWKWLMLTPTSPYWSLSDNGYITSELFHIKNIKNIGNIKFNGRPFIYFIDRISYTYH